MKKLLSLLLLFALVLSLFACSGGGNRGDGVTSCKNCGRKSTLVPGYGYCSRCFESFNKWQNETYAK